MVKNPKNWKLLKIAWNGEKIGQNWFLGPLPKKINILGGVHKNLVENQNKWKLLEIAWNGEKIGWIWFLDFLGPLNIQNYSCAGFIFLQYYTNIIPSISFHKIQISHYLHRPPSWVLFIVVLSCILHILKNLNKKKSLPNVLK